MALDNIIEIEENRRYLQLCNPASGEKIPAGVLINTDDEIRDEVRKVRNAHFFWNALGTKNRSVYFKALQKQIVKNSSYIVHWISKENGKNIAECYEEIAVVLGLLQAYRKNGFAYATKFHGSALNSFKKIKTTIFPASRGKNHGVVGVITPWNYPFMIPMNIAIRSLFYGNTVVLKPSEQTPFGGEMIRYLAAQAWEDCGFAEKCDYRPITLIQGDGAVGKMLINLLNEEKIDFVVFCGSSESGRAIKKSVLRKDRIELLLGGKDALIVLEDADLKMATKALVGGALFNAGQSCSSVERIYVAKNIYVSVVQRVLDMVKKMKVGYDPNDPNIDIGPIMNKRQFDILMDHLADAKFNGARILYGGKRLTGGIYDKGYYLPPTVLVDVNHTMKIMTEETFGPIIPIMTAETEDELIRLANDSKFGLTASVWTKDIAGGEQIAEQLEAGTVYVNDVFWTASEPKVHWPGAKESGNGIEEGDPLFDRVIAITRGNLVDRLSQFWLSKNTPGKIRLFKIIVKYGYMF